MVLAAEISHLAAGGALIEGRTYIVEWDGSETRVTDPARARELLQHAATPDAAELWVMIDHGPRRRSWLARLLGLIDREIEPCFCLTKRGDVAAMSFLDEVWSEYRATDPAQPTVDQRMALSGGDSQLRAISSSCNGRGS